MYRSQVRVPLGPLSDWEPGTPIRRGIAIVTKDPNKHANYACWGASKWLADQVKTQLDFCFCPGRPPIFACKAVTPFS